MIKSKDGIRLEVIASTADDMEVPVPERPVVTENSVRDVIQYKGKVYAVPREMIVYFADHPENLPGRIRRSLRNGVGMMYPDGGYGCPYCNHYQDNIANLLASGQMDGPMVFDAGDIGIPGIHVKGCQYQRAEDVKWATEFKNIETGQVVMAQRTPCVVDDSLIAELAEKGLLEEYLAEREFDFPTIRTVMGLPDPAETYELKPVQLSWWERIKKMFGR